MVVHKVVTVGNCGVGKSSLTIQFVSAHFVDEYDPTIEDSYSKAAVIDDEACVLDLLDTTNSPENFGMKDQYMRAGEAFVCVYSIASKFSFEDIGNYRDDILRIKYPYDIVVVPMILVGNKSDLEEERQVTKEEGQGLANSFGCPFFETSAKNRINIEEVFYGAVREIRKLQGHIRPCRPKKKNCCVF